jgi:L-xylulokinase
MAKYLMGIDNGGTSIKCAIFDLQGNEIVVASRWVDMIIPKPGMTERDANTVWQFNIGVIREALEKSGIQPQDILGVGLTGYGNGICLVDGQGQPTDNCIVSTDNRGVKYAEFYAQNGVEEQAFALTHQTLWSAQPAALLPWYRDHAPNVLQKSTYALGIKDYIRMKLTGVFSCEPTESSSWGLMNIHTLNFDLRLFQMMGIEDCFRLMPPCIGSTEICGRITPEASRLTGLAVGTPVASGCFDVDAGALASGVLDCETLCLIAGTWSINEHLTTQLTRGYRQTTNSISMSFLPGHFLVEESTPTSASNFDWFVEKFIAADRPGLARGELFRECDQRVAEMSPDENDVVFVPYLFASATHPDAKGVFLNLSSYHNRDHLLQAVYEGVVFSTLFHVKRLMTDGRQFKHARLSGGVANSTVWTQMMSDALQMPIEILSGSELSAQGAAICAGIACGAFNSYEHAVSQMVRVKKVFTPREAFAAVYQKKFAVYEKAQAALDYFHESMKTV